MDKQASAKAWILAMAGVFIVGVVYIAMTGPYQIISDNLSAGISAAYQPTVTKINNVWRVWPILVILGLVIGAIAMSLRRGQEPYQEY